MAREQGRLTRSLSLKTTRSDKALWLQFDYSYYSSRAPTQCRLWPLSGERVPKLHFLHSGLLTRGTFGQIDQVPLCFVIMAYSRSSAGTAHGIWKDTTSLEGRSPPQPALPQKTKACAPTTLAAAPCLPVGSIGGRAIQLSVSGS